MNKKFPKNYQTKKRLLCSVLLENTQEVDKRGKKSMGKHKTWLRVSPHLLSALAAS